MADNRPTVYEEDGNWIYRASGSGACLKYLVAIALGYEDQRGKKWDDLLDRSAREGNFHEETIIKTLKEAGIEVERQQEEVMIQIIPGVFIRGHIEGLVVLEPRELLEIKSMSTKQFAKWTNRGFEAFPNYAAQITGYMQAFPELDVRYIIKRREDGHHTEFTIPAGEPPANWKAIRKKIILAEKYRKKGELPPCDTDLQWGCPVWYLHDEDDPDQEVEELSEEETELLAELVENYRELKEIEERGKKAEEERKKLNPKILNMLGKGTDQRKFKWKGKDYQVTRRKGGGARLDKAKIKEIIGDDRMEEVETKYRYEYPIIKETQKVEKE